MTFGSSLTFQGEMFIVLNVYIHNFYIKPFWGLVDALSIHIV